MKKIVIVSDTHGNKTALKKVENIILESDLAIHLGDGLSDVFSLCEEAQKKFVLIEGNCDKNSGLSTERVIEIEGKKIFLTHGHLFGVKGKKDKLIEYAKSLKCDVALYGHTHKCSVDKFETITLINPGTLSRTNPEWSFCYLIIEKNKIIATINKNIFAF